MSRVTTLSNRAPTRLPSGGVDPTYSMNFLSSEEHPQLYTGLAITTASAPLTKRWVRR